MTATKNTPPPAEVAQHAGFGAALAAFQAALPSVRKGQTAKVVSGKANYSYDYADLTDVSEVVLPLLGAQGLAWHSGLDMDDNGNVVITWELIHAGSNEGRSGRLPVGRGGADWQSLGSAITYARRYALCAATGVAPGGDDDDAAAHVAAGNRQQAPVQAAIERQPERLPAGLYNLAELKDVEAVREAFRLARAAGHLGLLVGKETPEGLVEIPLGQHLTDVGNALAPAPDEAPAPAPVDDAAPSPEELEADAQRERDLLDSAEAAQAAAEATE